MKNYNILVRIEDCETGHRLQVELKDCPTDAGGVSRNPLLAAVCEALECGATQEELNADFAEVGLIGAPVISTGPIPGAGGLVRSRNTQ